MEKNKSSIYDLSFAFALRIIDLYKHLVEENEFVMSKQLLRSGTSIGANVREARNAESKMDFVHKMGIAQKECDETLYWLELLYASEFISKDVFEAIYADNISLLKILKSIILSSKKNMTNP